MAVWETDEIPSQCRPALNHAIEVWLPWTSTWPVFGRALIGPFQITTPMVADPQREAAFRGGERCGIREGDFVFYSAFEWQDRKGPCETNETFLRAFPDPAPAMLIVKSNPGATSALAEIRYRVRSSAREELRCEAWSDEQIEALQDRGACYVSLHRGEGGLSSMRRAAARRWSQPVFPGRSITSILACITSCDTSRRPCDSATPTSDALGEPDVGTRRGADVLSVCRARRQQGSSGGGRALPSRILDRDNRLRRAPTPTATAPP